MLLFLVLVFIVPVNIIQKFLFAVVSVSFFKYIRNLGQSLVYWF